MKLSVYKCASCGAVREARCKPRKYKGCGGNEFERQDAPQKKGRASRSSSRCEK